MCVLLVNKGPGTGHRRRAGAAQVGPWHWVLGVALTLVNWVPDSDRVLTLVDWVPDSDRALTLVWGVSDSGGWGGSDTGERGP